MPRRYQTVGDLVKALTSTTRSAQIGRLILSARCQPCVDCGQQYPPQVMEFDHVRGARLVPLTPSTQYPLKMVEEEIAKCDLRCPLCHRLRHYWIERPDDSYFIEHPPKPSWVTARDFVGAF